MAESKRKAYSNSQGRVVVVPEGSRRQKLMARSKAWSDAKVSDYDSGRRSQPDES